ncbi:MAG: hypothetical protein WBO17_07590 [Sphingorhabdus sp.]
MSVERPQALAGLLDLGLDLVLGHHLPRFGTGWRHGGQEKDDKQSRHLVQPSLSGAPIPES